MAEIYWPAGVGDDPLKAPSWEPVENGVEFTVGAGQFRGAPRNVGVAVNMTGIYPMSEHQYFGLWLPWWLARKSAGGCENGRVAFWLRDPIDRSGGVRKPYRWVRQPGQAMRPTRDGEGWLISLPLLRLPT